MSRDLLPEGVPASNEKQNFKDQEFPGPPETATPQFADGEPAARKRSLKQTREVYVRIDEEDDDEASDDNDRDDHRGDNHDDNRDDHGDDIVFHNHPPPGVMPILLAVAVLLIALGALVVMNNREPQP